MGMRPIGDANKLPKISTDIVFTNPNDQVKYLILFGFHLVAE
jgi:hypothetical protein